MHSLMAHYDVRDIQDNECWICGNKKWNCTCERCEECGGTVDACECEGVVV